MKARSALCFLLWIISDRISIFSISKGGDVSWQRDE